MKKSMLLVLIVFLVTVLCGCKSSDYKKATQLMQAGDYEKAANLYRTLEDYKDAEERTTMLEVKAIMVKYQKYYDEMNELSLMNFNAEVKPLEGIISEFEELDMEKISQYPDLDEYVQKVVTANFGFEWLIEKDRGYLDALFNGTDKTPMLTELLIRETDATFRSILKQMLAFDFPYNYLFE